MTSLQPAKPMTPTPTGPHLPHELTWCAAEANHEINTAVTQLADANNRVIKAVIGLLAVVSLWATSTHTDLHNFADLLVAAAISVGAYTGLQIWRLQANTLNAQQALQTITTTRRVEVKGDLVDVTTLLTQPTKKQP